MVEALASTRASNAGEEAGLAIPLASGNEEMLVNDGTAPVGDGPSAPSAGELIEPGRALALADFAPPSISAGERLLRFAYRLGIPGTTLSGLSPALVRTSP